MVLDNRQDDLGLSKSERLGGQGRISARMKKDSLNPGNHQGFRGDTTEWERRVLPEAMNVLTYLPVSEDDL